MSYKPSEIKYAWGVEPVELEQLIFEGWAVIALNTYGSPEEGFQVLAILRRPLPEKQEEKEPAAA